MWYLHDGAAVVGNGIPNQFHAGDEKTALLYECFVICAIFRFTAIKSANIVLLFCS